MSAMENMAKNILLSIVPPEVMAQLTKENVEAITTRAKAFVDTQAAMQAEQIEQRKILEEILENVRNSGGKRKPVIRSDANGSAD